jgi:hypothetical protein
MRGSSSIYLSNQCALIPSEMLKVLGEANIFLKQIPLPGMTPASL